MCETGWNQSYSATNSVKFPTWDEWASENEAGQARRDDQWKDKDSMISIVIMI